MTRGALGEYPNILLLVLIDLFHIIGRLGGCTNIDLAECIVGSGIQYQTIVRSNASVSVPIAVTLVILL